MEKSNNDDNNESYDKDVGDRDRDRNVSNSGDNDDDVLCFNGEEGEVIVTKMSGRPTNAMESIIVSMTSGIKV